MNKASRLNRLCLFFFAALLFQSCTEEEPFAPETPTMQFTFVLDGNAPTELPAGSIAVISISTLSGEAALTDHVVSIHPFENGFITEPIPLDASQYFITDFMIVHDDVALYATPKSGSELSKDIRTPLSHRVTLHEDTVLPLQVLATKNGAPAKFGYATFRMKDATQWKIMVFTREDGVLEASRAWTYLIAPGIAYGSEVQPGMNTLQFEGDPQQTYTLVVEKYGYETYKTDFVYENIRGKGNKPFKVVLDRVENENAFTIDPPKAEGEFTFNLGLRGSGSLAIDWGDGTVENLSFAPDPAQSEAGISFVAPSHDYSGPSPADGYRISITGDLEHIFAYESISVYASGLDPRNLPGLQRLSLLGMPINGLLDLSRNSQLQSVSFLVTYMWEVRLPESHAISQVSLTPELSPALVDMIIANIYDNAVAKNIVSGTVTIWPPIQWSVESEQKVQELVANYGWEVREME